MLTAIVIAVFLGIVLIDYIPNRKNRKRKENIFYGVAVAVSFLILILYSLNMTLPSPTQAIESVIKMVIPIE